MQVESIETNEVLASKNEDGADRTYSAQVEQSVVEGFETAVSCVGKCDAEIDVDSSAECVEDVAIGLKSSEGSALEATVKVQADAVSEVDSRDQSMEAEVGATVFAIAPPEAGKDGEGGGCEVAGLDLADGVEKAISQVGPEKDGEAGEVGALDSAVTVDDATVPETCREDAGKDAVVRWTQVSNAEFVRVLSACLPQGTALPVCSKSGDPTQGGWQALRAVDIDRQCPANRNNFVNTAAFWPDAEGSVRARQTDFAALLAVVLDDVDTKIPRERLAGVEATWEIETSPGNFQVGFVLSQPVTDVQEATKFQAAFVAAGLCDPGATGVTRWVRQPRAINGKAKYRNKSGQPWSCKLAVWNQDKRFTCEELLAAFGLSMCDESAQKPTDSVVSGESTMGKKVTQSDNDVYAPRAVKNPVVEALKERGLYKHVISVGKHEVTCPWVGEHTDALDTGAAYYEPSKQFPTGGFRCQHSHGDKHHIGDLLEFLDVDSSEARHKARIRLIPGEINGILDAAEQVLVERGNYYQAGGLIVSVKVDPKTGDPSILPVSEQALTQELVFNCVS